MFKSGKLSLFFHLTFQFTKTPLCFALLPSFGGLNRPESAFRPHNEYNEITLKNNPRQERTQLPEQVKKLADEIKELSGEKPSRIQ